MEALIKGLVLAITFIGIVVLISLFMAWPVMLLWNWLIPSIFGLKFLSFWEAWGIMFLSSLLFKSSSSSSK
jgi:hypothetical protein